jgi:hypothetical protein
MKKANIVLDNKSTGLTIIEKMSFERVDAVQDALGFAFHPDELDEDDELDERYLALWHVFLATVGWTDNEYWAEYKSRSHLRNCPDCGKLMDKEGDHVDENGKPKNDSKSN